MRAGTFCNTSSTLSLLTVSSVTGFIVCHLQRQVQDEHNQVHICIIIPGLHRDNRHSGISPWHCFHRQITIIAGHLLERSEQGRKAMQANMLMV